MFSLPRVTWADIAEADLPHLSGLLSRSMIAQLSPRTAGSRTAAADGYATIGAGNRADGVADELLGGYAMDRTERVDGRYAYQAYRARVGEPADGDVLHLGIAEVRSANEQGRYDAAPGALGSALHRAGHSTAVIGNADSSGVFHRSAALAMMDRRGVVDGGTVSTGLITADPTAPYGFSMNQAAAVQAFETAWRTHDVTLVEASDLERVDTFAPLALPEAWQKLRRDALVEADRLLGELLTRVDLDRDLVMVMSPAAPSAGEELGVFGMAGPGVRPGVAVSGTTRRNSYLTLPDIAPTVLERLGVAVPPEITGTPVKLGEARPVDQELMSGYARANEVAVFRDRVTTPVTVVFIVLQLLAYVLAALLLVLRGRVLRGRLVSRGRRRPGSRWRPTTRILLLTVLALPTTTFLSGLLPYDWLGPAGYVATLIVAAAGLAAGSVWLGWALRRVLPAAAPMLPPLAIIAVTWVTMIIDVLFYNGRLQLDTVFGYSPIVAGRFSGYGNFAFSLVAICAVIIVTGGWAITALSRRRSAEARPSPTAAAPEASPADAGASPAEASPADAEARSGGAAGNREATWQPNRRWKAAALVVAALVLGFTVVVDGYPAYGSDIGGVLAAVPSFALVLLLLAGVTITWRRLALVGVVTVATIGAFAAVDLTRPVEQRTHLGRMVERMDGTGGVLTIVERKLLANLNILTSSIWTWVVPIAAAFLIVLSLRRLDALGSLRREIPGMVACLWGAAVVAALGFALNDSGIAVPAMMSTMLLPYLGYLVLREPIEALDGADPGTTGETPDPGGTMPEQQPAPEPAPQT